MTTDPFELLTRFVAVPSVTGTEEAYARLVAATLEQDGFAVELDEMLPGRPNVLARPASGPAPRVWFSTHLDVVPPHIPPRIEGERLYGRGACDTKGPLVAMLGAARRLRAASIPVGFLLVVGEEVDHSGAAFAARRARLGEGARIILGEPTSNRVAAAQKGLLKVRLDAVGRAGHSAFPDRGVSAIHRLLALLEAMGREPWPSHPVLGPQTWNCGLIQGGVAANVFAPSAWAEVLMRLVQPSLDALARVEALAAGAPAGGSEGRAPAGARVDGVSVSVVSRNDPVLFEAPAGFETCVIPFNSDASYLAPLGPVWLCGPGAIEVAHSEHEHIDRADLLAGVDVYERLARAALA